MGKNLEEGPLDMERLKQRAVHYAKQGGADTTVVKSLVQFLEGSLAQRLVALSVAELYHALVNDAYKPKMHSLYSKYYQAVEAEFSLNVRKTPFPLERIRKEDPELFSDFVHHVKTLSRMHPVSDRSTHILEQYYNFHTSEEMRERAERFGVAKIVWQEADKDTEQLMAFASGAVEAASNMETSMTQAVQEFTIRAQARELFRCTGTKLDRTERLANSLGHLASVVSKLSTVQNPVKMALFAGRRATDRLFLLLQNAFCALHLPGYVGTSAIFAVDKIDAALLADGMVSPEERHRNIGVLVGTHAHEVMSISAQLLSCWDDRVRSEDPGPVALSALLAHLLFLAANGGLENATALADTFGTEAFLAASLVAKVPQEFVEDMQARYGEEHRLKPGTVVFDIIRTWRLDSGDYATIAEAVMQAWEMRCSQLGPDAPPRPTFMNSNLSSAEDILEAARLPDRIRPSICAFGGLADGFLPFDLGDGKTAELGVANVVMKAVQGRRPDQEPCMPCAGKLGDDANHTKAQVDPRLPPETRDAAKSRMLYMFAQRRVDPESATRVLAEMYIDVTRRKIFC